MKNIILGCQIDNASNLKLIPFLISKNELTTMTKRSLMNSQEVRVWPRKELISSDGSKVSHGSTHFGSPRHPCEGASLTIVEEHSSKELKNKIVIVSLVVLNKPDQPHLGKDTVHLKIQISTGVHKLKVHVPMRCNFVLLSLEYLLIDTALESVPEPVINIILSASNIRISLTLFTVLSLAHLIDIINGKGIRLNIPLIIFYFIIISLLLISLIVLILN